MNTVINILKTNMLGNYFCSLKIYRSYGIWIERFQKCHRLNNIR